MKIRLVKINTIEAYALNNARSRPSFGLWLKLIKKADWIVPKDIIDAFGSADLLGNGSNRVVFDIGETKVHLFIKWIGTHAEYTQLCDRNEQYTINFY